MLNLIAFIICSLGAIVWGFRGDIGMVLFQIMLALINLPWMLEWLGGR